MSSAEFSTFGDTILVFGFKVAAPILTFWLEESVLTTKSPCWRPIAFSNTQRKKCLRASIAEKVLDFFYIYKSFVY